MNDITFLKKFNVNFKIIKEVVAQKILVEEVPCSILFEYSKLFETYNSTERKGQFIDLDFSQLYSAFNVDMELKKFLMNLCLEIEFKIKSILFFESQKIINLKEYLLNYIKNDFEFLSENITFDLDEFIKSIDEDKFYFDKFIYEIHGGVLEKFIYSFYNIYQSELQNTKVLSCLKRFSSFRTIRNLIAHNQPFLSKLSVVKPMIKNSLAPFLSRKGIKQKTLHTNLSKPIVFDLCNLLVLCSEIYDFKEFKKIGKQLKKLLLGLKRKNTRFLSNNQTLTSSYRFLMSVLKILP